MKTREEKIRRGSGFFFFQPFFHLPITFPQACLKTLKAQQMFPSLNPFLETHSRLKKTPSISKDLMSALLRRATTSSLALRGPGSVFVKSSARCLASSSSSSSSSSQSESQSQSESRSQSPPTLYVVFWKKILVYPVKCWIFLST